MELFNQFTQRGRDFLGVKYPIICGAMTWISNAPLVTSVCQNGGFGVIAGGNMPPDLLAQEIDLCREKITTPFGVNVITIAPNYRQHLDVIEKKDVKVVVFAGTIPAKDEIARMKNSGKKVLAFAPAESIAKRMLKFGADALIIEGTEAGGHIGPVSTMVLLQEILQSFKKECPIFVAGGIATGEMVAHLLLMGAVGVQLGTRFVMTEECTVHANMKQAFCRAGARNAIASTQVDPTLPVVAVRALKNTASEDFAKLQIELIQKINKGEITREQGILLVENFWMGGLKKAAIDGDIEKGSVMAGQSVGLMDTIKPMAQVFADLTTEAENELQRVKKMFA